MKSKRRLRRFFYPGCLPAAGAILSLPKAESHHLKDILRLRKGDACLVMGQQGAEAICQITDILDDGSVCLKIETVPSKEIDRYPFKIRVFQALAQKGKLDFLVEKAQELGVDEFCPIETQYSPLRLSKESRDKVWKRWNKKVVEAAKQSGSLKLMEIAPFRDFEETFAAIPANEEVTIFHPGPAAVPFSHWVRDLKSDSSGESACRLNLFFGPEGGFSPQEIEFAQTSLAGRGNKCTMVSLGKSILRLETAFLGAIASLRFLYL
ncbi:MAG: RsmE family RNA methyltransferase [Candidatus Omnitrophica bacterium]|nr:RsmE family RNA methyltransferase [Candidatus Omnitrophota bacterium]MDD5670614.1 RsmE family RNA methyltransferase [Candidatus Omnitrophota bacterium]